MEISRGIDTIPQEAFPKEHLLHFLVLPPFLKRAHLLCYAQEFRSPLLVNVSRPTGILSLFLLKLEFCGQTPPKRVNLSLRRFPFPQFIFFVYTDGISGRQQFHSPIPRSGKTLNRKFFSQWCKYLIPNGKLRDLRHR